MKKILFVASEAVPFIKTGGLADVVGSLPKYFDKEQYDIRVMIPKYMCIRQEWKDQMKYCLLYTSRPLLIWANSWSVGMTLDRNPGLILSEFGR